MAGAVYSVQGSSIPVAAFQLALLAAGKIRSVFHVSLLKRFLSNAEAEGPPPLTLIGGQDNQSEVQLLNLSAFT